MSEFNKGILVSVALLSRMHGLGIELYDLLNDCGLKDADCAELDEFDKIQLRKLNKQEGLQLKGL